LQEIFSPKYQGYLFQFCKEQSRFDWLEGKAQEVCQMLLSFDCMDEGPTDLKYLMKLQQKGLDAVRYYRPKAAQVNASDLKELINQVFSFYCSDGNPSELLTTKSNPYLKCLYKNIIKVGQINLLDFTEVYELLLGPIIRQQKAKLDVKLSKFL